MSSKNIILLNAVSVGAKRIKGSWETTLTSIKEVFGIYPAVHKLPDPRMPGVVPDLLGPFELVGDNWYSSKDLPIAILWGFNPWKRNFIQAYFPEHKLAFVRGARGFIRLRRLLRRFPKHKEFLFVGWGTKLPKYAERYAERHKIAVRYVEDGFLRSFHPGALHTKPWSLTIDAQAPYYTTQQSTDLQELLTRTAQKDKNDKAGEAGIALMRAGRLTKYFSLRIGDDVWTPPLIDDRKIILVIGQIEDDAAILKGYARKWFGPRFSNLLVVQKAIKDHPDAYVIYRPHPDTFLNGRKSRHERKIAKMCTVVEPIVPLHSLFPHVDHVYSGTSLAAFEAALLDIPVTTLGLPFYAASPAIDHLQGPRQGFGQLSLPRLFSVVYLEYPRYIHPDSDEKTTFFDLASYFIVEKFKHLILVGVPEDVLDLAALRDQWAYLTPPARLFLHLLDLGRTGEEAPEKLVAFAGDPLRYEDIPQFSELLIKACHFDALALYLEKAVAQFTRDLEDLKTRKELMTRVIDTFIDSQKTLRGRIGITLPDMADWIAPPRFSGYLVPDALLLAYARALANNLQYDVLERVVENMEQYNRHAETPHGVSMLRAFVALLVERPARSERNAAKRAELSDRVGRLYHEQLAMNPELSPVLARALSEMALDRPHSCKAACDEWLARLDAQSEGSTALSVRKQTPSILSLVIYLANQSMHETVDRLMARLDPNDTRVQLQKLRLAVGRRDLVAFHALYEGLPDDVKARNEVTDLHMRTLMEEGEFLAAREVVRQNLALTTISRKKRALLYEQQEKLDFSLEAGRILGAAPQPHLPKGVVFLGTTTDYRSLAMLVPVLVEIRRKGYAVINLTNGILPQTHTGVEFLDNFIGSVQATGRTRKIIHNNEWFVDWKGKKVINDGINYHQGFYEALSNSHRRYDIDINNENIRREFFFRLSLADNYLDAVKRIRREVSGRGLPAIILSGDGHTVPGSVFRDFCRAHKHPLLSYVNVNIGYENYFTNLGSRYASSMTIGDMTLFPNHRAPFLARADRFERWYAQERETEVFRQRADELINFNRVHARDASQSQALAAYLSQERQKGRKIVCCLGKIPIDLGVPYDGGPAHEDLRDWLNHTIDSVRGCDDILLLIKPHPHEVQPSIALDLVDKLTDLIDVPLPDNVRVLDHREINNHQLAPHLDLALMWNGSSSLELTARGVPVMMAGYFGRYDYPVELLYPEDREQYRQFITNRNWPQPDEEVRRKAAYLIAYMETPDVTLRNDYAWRPVTNDSIGVPTWRSDRVATLMRDGDPEMVRAAARILERFEGGGT